ncbi:MAG: F0F1 ATP synthase subunit epsilon [Acidobacteria bacterium]|nr:F0F1 ATP synthase subunit epsilon [Acidobacteriota bacterium]
MSNTLKLEVVTPERPVLSEQVSEVQFPTATEGYYGILPGHTPVMAPVGDGLLHFVKDGQKHWLTVFGGFAEVGPDHVTILARASETADAIDVDRAEAARKRAADRLAQAKEDLDMDRARAALQRAMERLEAAKNSGAGRPA